MVFGLAYLFPIGPEIFRILLEYFFLTPMMNFQIIYYPPTGEADILIKENNECVSISGIEK